MVLRKQKTVMPTPAEFRILDVLWRLGEGTVDDIITHSDSDKPQNYKTVQSFLRIMEDKRLVRHFTRGRSFVFAPLITREEVARGSVRQLLERNFQGSPTELLVNLLEASDIKDSELDELETLIRQYRQKKGKL